MEQPDTHQMKTVLYNQHVSLGAKMADFAGWRMPIHYSGVIAEHNAVRHHAGLFDVSHMGRILIEGLQAEAFVDFLSTNTITGKPFGSATYTVLCNENGGSIDDVIIYKTDGTHFFLITNAANRQKDLDHMIKHSASFDVTITPRFTQDALIALQGPEAKFILCRLFPSCSTLRPMHFMVDKYKEYEAIIAATGYTGAGGFEICVPNEAAEKLWNELLDIGKDKGIVPAGLAARDTLRLEMGYALYGHELNDGTLPAESVSCWTVKSKEHNFIGREAQQHPTRWQHGIVLIDKGIAREGHLAYKDNKQIGVVTSGTFSPTLQRSIAIISSTEPLINGDRIEVEVRGNRCLSEVVKLPFLTSIQKKTT